MNRAKELREKLRLTQQEVADAVDIDKLTLIRFEAGKCSMRIDNVWKIADFFDVSIDYLIGRSDNPKSFDPEDHTRITPSFKDAGGLFPNGEVPKDVKELTRLIERMVQIALDERESKG